MSVDTKIYVDAGRPATLNDGAGNLTDCATLQEAVLAWHTLPSAQKIRATVKVIGGRCTRRIRSIGTRDYLARYRETDDRTKPTDATGPAEPRRLDLTIIVSTHILTARVHQ